ncbi:hypothetical protein S83_062780, partial [Arachis hypogaea]
MEQSQSNPQPQDNTVQESQTSSFRVKYDKNNKTQYTCIFCLNTYNGGGIYRIKYHLTKIPGQIKMLNFNSKGSWRQTKKNKAEKRKFAGDCFDVKIQAQEECESSNPVQPPAPATMGDKGKRRAITATPIGSYFKGRTT